MGWNEISRLGESGFLLPLGLLLAVRFLRSHELRFGAIWLISFAAAVGLVLASKIAFLGWGIGIAAWDFTGFSGHTTLASAVYPVFLWTLCANRARALRLSAVALACVFAALVAFSRIALHAHSVSEVLGGYGLGAAVAGLTLANARPPRASAAPLGLLVLTLALAFDLGFGYRPPSHRIVVDIALYVSGHRVPYRRDEWLRQHGVAPRPLLPAIS